MFLMVGRIKSCNAPKVFTGEPKPVETEMSLYERPNRKKYQSNEKHPTTSLWNTKNKPVKCQNDNICNTQSQSHITTNHSIPFNPLPDTCKRYSSNLYLILLLRSFPLWKIKLLKKFLIQPNCKKKWNSCTPQINYGSSNFYCMPRNYRNRINDEEYKSQNNPESMETIHPYGGFHNCMRLDLCLVACFFVFHLIKRFHGTLINLHLRLILAAFSKYFHTLRQEKVLSLGENAKILRLNTKICHKWCMYIGDSINA